MKFFFVRILGCRLWGETLYLLGSPKPSVGFSHLDWPKFDLDRQVAGSVVFCFLSQSQLER